MFMRVLALSAEDLDVVAERIEKLRELSEERFAMQEAEDNTENCVRFSKQQRSPSVPVKT